MRTKPVRREEVRFDEERINRCDLSKLWSAAWVGALLQLPNAACLERGGSHHRSYSAGKEGRTQGRVARLARHISGSL